MKLYTLCQCVALPLSTYSTKWCLFLKKMYSLYSLRMYPNCLSVASEAPLRTRKECMQLITSHYKKDYDGKTNDRSSKWFLFFFTVLVTSLGPSPQSRLNVNKASLAVQYVRFGWHWGRGRSLMEYPNCLGQTIFLCPAVSSGIHIQELPGDPLTQSLYTSPLAQSPHISPGSMDQCPHISDQVSTHLPGSFFHTSCTMTF